MPSVEVIPTRRHADDRDPRRRAGSEEQVDDRLRDVLRLALRGVGVHPEPRSRVDLDDRAPRLADGDGDVGADEVDAGDVEPDHARRHLGDLDVVGMGLLGPVDRRSPGRHVPGQRELDGRPGRRHRLHLEALLADELDGRLGDGDLGEDLLVTDAAARIRVRDLHQLAHRVRAVAGHGGRDALGDRRDLPADDEAAIVAAVDVRLDDDLARPRLAPGVRECAPNIVLRAEIEMDAPAVVAVERLDDARVAELPGGADGCVLVVDDLRARDGQAGRVEQPVREVLVARDVDRDAGRPRCHRRADPLLVDALAELDERVAVETDERDVARGGLVDDRLGGRSERLPLGEPDQPLELDAEVEGMGGVLRGDEVVDEADRELAGLQADGLLAELVDDVVPALLARAAGLAVAGVRAGEVLELEGDVLGDVARPRAVAEPGEESAAPVERAGVVLERGHEGDEAVHEARDRVRRERLEGAEVDQHPDDRRPRPVVRPAEHARLEDAERRLGGGAPTGGAVGRGAGSRALRAWARSAGGDRRRDGTVGIDLRCASLLGQRGCLHPLVGVSSMRVPLPPGVP
jgi:hypothetical protein